MRKKANMKVLFAGGFTLGSVTPLLAVAEELKNAKSGYPPVTIIWAGTRRGPERQLIQSAGIPYLRIFAPKWRRYFDLRNIAAPALLVYSVMMALCILLRHRPDAIVTAGGFLGVPLIWAGWLLRIPSLLHSQDVRWSLANRLAAPYAKRVTYTLPDTVPPRWKNKSVLTGNPVRGFILKGEKMRGLALCGFLPRRNCEASSGQEFRQSRVARDPAPAVWGGINTILVIGGGTGAKRLNEIISKALPELVKKFQVVHLTGRGKKEKLKMADEALQKRYCRFEFVADEIADLYTAADIVVTRAGMGALSELAALGKPMIIVPIPGTHQEANALYFQKNFGAIVAAQDTLETEKLLALSEWFVMQSKESRAAAVSKLRALAPQNATKRLAEEIFGLGKGTAP